MSYFERAISELASDKRPSAHSVQNEAFEIYLALHPEVHTAIQQYATKHRIPVSTAVAEACRSYFVGE